MAQRVVARCRYCRRDFEPETESPHDFQFDRLKLLQYFWPDGEPRYSTTGFVRSDQNACPECVASISEAMRARIEQLRAGGGLGDGTG